MNRGAKQLQRFFQRPGVVARRLRVSASMFSLILHGHRKPGRRLAAAIEREYEIPISAWGDEIRERKR